MADDTDNETPESTTGEQAPEVEAQAPEPTEVDIPESETPAAEAPEPTEAETPEAEAPEDRQLHSEETTGEYLRAEAIRHGTLPDTPEHGAAHH